MKKILVALFISILGYSQDYPKDAVELLVGKNLKILSCDYCVKSGYSNFYNKSDLKYSSKLKHKYDDLNGKIFTLKSFTKNIGSLKDNILLELYNTEQGTIYYEYSPWSKGFWIFEIIGGIKYPEGYWCKDIIKNEDKFSNSVKYYSPPNEHVSFTKIDKIIYIYLKSHGKTLNTSSKGIIILLKDGSKINNDSAIIDVEADGDGYYTYTTMFALSEQDIIKISNSYITDYRLYIYDFALDNGSLFTEYLNCLTKI